MEELLTMLSYRRPAGSKHERKFIRRFLEPLGVQADDFGNMILRVGDSRVLWSSHTDTVHRDSGRQTVTVTGGIAKAPTSDCLGADCTTGVWLMMEMIRAKVPGLYIFHRAEEVGGQGSDYIAKMTPHLLKGIDYAIALDRKGCKSVITHQFGQRCASDAFARSFADAVNLPMQPDDGGSFTDTANYTDLVGECTNISVGYRDQHTHRETQDLIFARELRDALVHFDESRLVASRVPGEVDTDYYGYHYADKGWAYTTPSRMDRQEMERLVSYYPAAAARLLADYGVTADELVAAAYEDDRGAVSSYLRTA